MRTGVSTASIQGDTAQSGKGKGKFKEKGKTKQAWQCIHYIILQAGLDIPDQHIRREESGRATGATAVIGSDKAARASGVWCLRTSLALWACG